MLYEQFLGRHDDPSGGTAVEYALSLMERSGESQREELRRATANTWRQPFWLIGEDADVRSRGLRPGR